MELDLLIHTVDAEPRDVVAAAVAAEEAGFSGVWVWDHLCGASTWGSWNLECWTMLCAIAARTERVSLGPLVLNVANRDAGTTAVAAATLQRLSGGRLLLALGAGGGPRNPYARDQFDLGRTPPADPERRAAVVATIRETREVWGEGDHTFVRPEPKPPIIVGCFGPKMVSIAADKADGLAVPLDGFIGGPPMEELIALAREKRAQTGLRPLLTVVHAHPRTHFDDERWRPGGEVWQRLVEAQVDRFVLQATPPVADTIRAMAPRFFEARA